MHMRHLVPGSLPLGLKAASFPVSNYRLTVLLMDPYLDKQQVRDIGASTGWNSVATKKRSIELEYSLVLLEGSYALSAQVHA